jgi:hypothetical protein
MMNIYDDMIHVFGLFYLKKLGDFDLFLEDELDEFSSPLSRCLHLDDFLLLPTRLDDG